MYDGMGNRITGTDNHYLTMITIKMPRTFAVCCTGAVYIRRK